MKQGFTLIELLIATALASIISALLIAMWQQMNQVRTRVDRYADMYQRAVLVSTQLERDLSGVFVPVEADMTQAGVAEQPAAPASDTKKEGNTPRATPAQKAGPPQDEGPKKLEKVLWGDHSLTMLTFVTNNTMQHYWSVKLAQQTAAQPRMARVIYTLVPEKQKKDSFVLMRQESEQIYFDVMSEKKAPSYALATGIKGVRISYVVYVKIPSDKKGTANVSQKQAPESETFEKKVVQEWHKITDNKPPWPLVPQWVLMDIDFWDTAHERVQTFHFEFQIMPRFDKKEPAAQRPPVGLQLPAIPSFTPPGKSVSGNQRSASSRSQPPRFGTSVASRTHSTHIVQVPIVPEAGIVAYGVR